MSLFLVSKKVSYTNATTIEMSVQKHSTPAFALRVTVPPETHPHRSSLCPGTLGVKVPRSGPWLLAMRQHDLPETPPRSEHTEVQSRLKTGEVSWHTFPWRSKPHPRGPVLCLLAVQRNSSGYERRWGRVGNHTLGDSDYTCVWQDRSVYSQAWSSRKKNSYKELLKEKTTNGVTQYPPSSALSKLTWHLSCTVCLLWTHLKAISIEIYNTYKE